MSLKYVPSEQMARNHKAFAAAMLLNRAVAHTGLLNHDLAYQVDR